jgi:hypothetical protein
MYRRRSCSFSAWNRRMSFSTPELASFVSFSATTTACSSYQTLAPYPPTMQRSANLM